QLRRIDRPAAKYDFAPRPRRLFPPTAPVADADCATPIEGDPSREGVRDHLKIGAFHRRLEIGVGGRPSDAVLHRHAEWAKPLLPLAVEVGADRIVRLPARLDEGVVERVGFSAMRRRQRSGVAAIRVGVALKALSATKVGQHISISPPPCALFLPALEIERMSADIDHAVDRRRAAQTLAPRTADAPPAALCLR